MNISVITAHSDLPSNRLLQKAAQNKKWSLDFLDPFQDIQNIKKTPDITLMRLGLTGLREGLRLGDKLSEKKSRVINATPSIARAKNKWTSQQAFISSQLPTIPTLLASNQESLEILKTPFDHFPLVLKTLYGSKGIGVHLVNSLSQLKETANIYFKKNHSVLVQPHIDIECDLRIFVVGNRVVASVNRKPSQGNFRSNWHQGASLEIFHPSQEVSDLAIQATNTLGLEIAGIDIAISQEKNFLIEANDSPGLEGISSIHKRNLAEDICDYLEEAI